MRLLDSLANFLSPRLDVPSEPRRVRLPSTRPVAPPPFNHTRLTPPLNHLGELIPMPITKELILRAIAEVEDDPTAGIGTLTKRDLLVDKLMRLFNAGAPAEAVKTPAPLLSEPKKIAAVQPVARPVTATTPAAAVGGLATPNKSVAS